MSQNVNYAVFSGELAERKKISQEKLGRIPDIIRNVFDEVQKTLPEETMLDYEIIRMDEFLGIIENPVTAIHILLLLATEFRFNAYRELDFRADLRLSLAIGPVELYKKQLRESDGTALRKASEGLNTMKRNQRLVIQTPRTDLDHEFKVSCGFMDILIHDWSDEQAEALFHSFTGKNQVQISEVLDISQPAVNRRLKAAHFEAIERFIQRYEKVIENI